MTLLEAPAVGSRYDYGPNFSKTIACSVRLWRDSRRCTHSGPSPDAWPRSCGTWHSTQRKANLMIHISSWRREPGTTVSIMALSAAPPFGKRQSDDSTTFQLRRTCEPKVLLRCSRRSYHCGKVWTWRRAQ